MFGHGRYSLLRLRREVTACLGVYAVLFQILMPITSAFAAGIPALQQSGQTTEVICVAGGRLISINGEQQNPERQTTACEFCMVCQFAIFGHVGTPDMSEYNVVFAPARIFWTGLSHAIANNSSDYAVRPVRAPPLYI